MIENPNKYKFRKIERIYSPSRIESFKLPPKPHNTLLRPGLSVIWGKVKNLLSIIKKPYHSILRSKDKSIEEVIEQKQEKEARKKYDSILRSEYTVKEGNGVKSSDGLRIKPYRSRTSIGLNPGVSIFKNMFRMFLKKEYIKKALALATIIAVIITADWQNAPQAGAIIAKIPKFAKIEA